jgi:hypothetical protein
VTTCGRQASGLARGRGRCWLPHEVLHTGFAGQALACASLRCNCTSLSSLPRCSPPAAAAPGEPEPERQQLFQCRSHCRQSAAQPQAPRHAASAGPQPLQAQVGRRRVSAGCCPGPHLGCCQQCILHWMYRQRNPHVGCLPPCVLQRAAQRAIPGGPSDAAAGREPADAAATRGAWRHGTAGALSSWAARIA